ncbi:MAG: hypothetical protein OEM39_00015 [Acidimicrobiia bacterium]|nr:hypothetical protein [Acidimicrobiia bacterium]
MDFRRLTLTYVVIYLAVAAVGFAFLPQQFMDLFRSNGDYGDVMPRLVGLMMGVLAFLIFNILRNKDWHYYIVSIYVRSVIVLFLFYLWGISDDPMFLLINVVVLIGLLPSIYVHFRRGE